MPKRMKFERSGGRKKVQPTDPGDFGALPHEAVTDPPGPSTVADMAAGGVDLVRGNSNLQTLTPGGAKTLLDTGKKLARAGGASRIVSSSAERAQESAQALQSADPNAPPISVDPGLESHAMGNLEGEPKSPQVKQLLSDLVRKSPNFRIPGQGSLSNRPGESFNDFRTRALSSVRGLMQQLADDPSQRIAVPDHSQVTKLVKAWVAAGHPDDLSIDPNVMLSDEKLKPGSVTRFAPDADGNWQAQPFDLNGKELPRGSIYFVEHGQTPATTAKSDQITSGQRARAQIIKYLRSMDFGRAQAEARRATSSGILSDQEIESALDEGLPSVQDAAALPPHHLLAVAAAGNPAQRQALQPVLQQRFGDLSALDPEAQRVLGAHLGKLTSPTG